MKLNHSRSVWILGALLLSLAALPVAAQERTHSNPSFEVTITNLTQGQIFAPPVVFSHRGSYKLFTPGEPAIAELAGVAEDADNAPLIALLGTEPRVGDVSSGDDVVMPGAHTTVRVSSRGGARYITVLGMLVTSNDAFFAGKIQVFGYPTSTYAMAWDAGSEANTQDCLHIPGPPCGNPGVRVEDGAEGYVYIHAGIQDRGSLDPAIHDWRNPVAKIEIRRARR